MAKVPQKSDLAINGGKPVHTKPWRTRPFHVSAEVAAGGGCAAGKGVVAPLQ